jgi:Protein of unknown function (DUF3224)
MTDTIKAEFEVASWDEQPFDEGTDLGKLTDALVTKTYTGDIDGTSTTKWLMAYAPDETATFVGIERIQGTIGGHSGSLVLQHVGEFKDGAAKATLTVLSGTNELTTASGDGDFLSDPAGSISLRLSVS